MIKVEFVYETVDEMVGALRRASELMGSAIGIPITEQPQSVAAPEATLAPEAGNPAPEETEQPKKKRKTTARTEAGIVTSDPAVQAWVNGEEPPPAEPKPVTRDELKIAFGRLAEVRGVDFARELLESFGAEKLSLLDTAKYDEVMAKVQDEMGERNG